MHRLLRVLGVMLGLAVTVSGAQQGAQQQERPTFRGTVDLVTIDVTVLDSDSRPVPGLTADDFEIKLDGRVQPVKIVSFVELGPAELAAPSAAASADGVFPERPVFSNESVPMPDPRVFVFLLDDLSMSPTRGRALLHGAQRFVKGLPARDYIGFATSSGTHIVNPTLDRPVVLDALSRAVGSATDPRSFSPSEPAGGRNDGTPDSAVGVAQALAIDHGDLGMLRDVIAMECFNGDRSLVDSQNISVLTGENDCVTAVVRQARRTATFTKAIVAQQASVLTSVIESMSDAPGFKQLVVITDGLAVGAEVAPLKPVALAAARAGVRISVMVEEPDLNMGDEGRRVMALDGSATVQADLGMPQRRREDGKLLLDGAATATEMAGGQLYRIIGDPDPFFDRVIRAGSAVYRLGVQALPETSVGREFEVEAKVKNRRGVTVAANRIAVVPEPEAPKEIAPPTIDEQLASAIRSGTPHFGVPIELGTVIRRSQNVSTRPGGAMALEVVVDVEIPASINGPLITMYGLVDGSGQLTNGRRELPAQPSGQPFTISFVLPVASGAYRLRFAAADAEGNLGSIEVPLDAALPTLGPFVSSDVLAAWVDERGQAHPLTLEALPAGTTSLIASMELYPAGETTPAGDIFVAWTISRAGETEPVDEREVVAQNMNGIQRAGAEFSTDLLEPGSYTIRATVRLGETVLGTLQKTFQVKPGVI